MRPFLFITLLNLLSCLCNAQSDTIVLVNGSKKAVIIKEISDQNVKYKLPADTTGPTYVIKKKLITKFILKDGCIDLKDKGYENCEKDPTFGVLQNDYFKKNIISLNVAQLLAKHFELNFEHVLPKRFLGIEAYGGLGLDDAMDHYIFESFSTKHNIMDGGNYYRKNYGGLNIKFYPFPHKKITYWLSAGAEYGTIAAKLTREVWRTEHYTNTYWPYNSYTYDHYVTETNYYNATYFGTHLYNGFIYRPIKHFSFQTFLGLAANSINHPTESNWKKVNQDIGFQFKFGINLGVNF